MTYCHRLAILAFYTAVFVTTLAPATMAKTDFEELLDSAITRRTFLSNTTRFGLAAFVVGGPLGLTACGDSNPENLPLESIPTSTADTITLGDDYDWYPLISWGDPLFSQVRAFDEDNRSGE